MSIDCIYTRKAIVNKLIRHFVYVFYINHAKAAKRIELLLYIFKTFYRL